MDCMTCELCLNKTQKHAVVRHPSILKQCVFTAPLTSPDYVLSIFIVWHVLSAKVCVSKIEKCNSVLMNFQWEWVEVCESIIGVQGFYHILSKAVYNLLGLK